MTGHLIRWSQAARRFPPLRTVTVRPALNGSTMSSIPKRWPVEARAWGPGRSDGSSKQPTIMLATTRRSGESSAVCADPCGRRVGGCEAEKRPVESGTWKPTGEAILWTTVSHNIVALVTPQAGRQLLGAPRRSEGGRGYRGGLRGEQGVDAAMEGHERSP